jgi:hypothetical protein
VGLPCTVRRWILVGLLAGCAGCGVRDLEQGRYAFIATADTVDDCEVLSSPEALWDGQLSHASDTVRLQYDLLPSRLTGLFKEASSAFMVSGSGAEVEQTLRGQSCLLDLVTVVLEGEPLSRTAFEGQLRVDFLAENRPECTCRLVTRYRADRVGP